MRIVTVVGARPQFVKAAAGSRQIRREHMEVLVHTGQHFDDNMSAIFFREMEIPEPDHYLGISGGSHARMTAAMLVSIEDILLQEKPDAVLVYGDTNSTLAAALAAVKLIIPVFHVEAGNRLGTLHNPEEANRITVDHLSSLCLCASKSAQDSLYREGLGERSKLVGNIMFDSFLHFAQRPWAPDLRNLQGESVPLPSAYYYMTCHRQENTYDEAPLMQILSAMDSLDAPTLYPVHPRNRAMAEAVVSNQGFKQIILLEPVSYANSVHLTKNAKKIVTDSGGLQCEAFFAGVQCVFVFDHVVWPETMVGYRNQLSKADKKDILNKLSKAQVVDPGYQPFGDGRAAEKICDAIREWRPA